MRDIAILTFMNEVPILADNKSRHKFRAFCAFAAPPRRRWGGPLVF
jgi:hypothetical protein